MPLVPPSSYAYDNKDVPATWRVLLFIIGIGSTVPLHCTTVQFSLAVAVNVRVEVKFARGAIELLMFVRVVTKSNSAHCTAAAPLQSKLVPVVAAVVNRTGSLSMMNGSTIQPRAIPWSTVQV